MAKEFNILMAYLDYVYETRPERSAQVAVREVKKFMAWREEEEATGWGGSRRRRAEQKARGRAYWDKRRKEEGNRGQA